MAKKKSVKKATKKSLKKKSLITLKKNSVKKKIVKKKKISKKSGSSIKRKFDIALKNFILFVVLFVSSLVLYKISTQEIYENLFYLFAIISGFVSVAFLMAILIFFFLRFLKK